MTDILTIGQVEASNVSRAIGIEISHDPAKRTALHRRMIQAWGMNASGNWEVGQGVCKVCGAKFCQPGEDFCGLKLPGTQEVYTLPTPVCEACSPLVAEHYRVAGNPETMQVSLTPQFDELCPPRFREALEAPTMPIRCDLRAFETVRGWEWHRRGIYAVGPTGTGKTLSFWALAGKIERTGTKPLIIGAVELGRRLQQAAKDMAAVPDLCHARVLMIDDLGKERATPAASSLLSEVLDHRYSHGLPLIVTTRFSSTELRARFAEPSIGEDITRRLYELCEGVTFQKNTEKKDDAG